MSPLRLTGDRPLPLQATAIADNVVAALLDINENQIFQSSRRYLYHAVIGAIALAAKQAPARELRGRLHAAAARPRTTSAPPSTRPAPTRPTSTRPPSSSAPSCPTTCAWPAARVAQRLDAPRNKVTGLTGVPPLRRFFNHPTDIAAAATSSRPATS